jgi:chorismate mutase
MPSLTFILTGQDDLSPVLDEAGDSAQRLRRRLDDVSKNGSGSMAELVKVTKMLAPAAIPAAASLVPIAAGAGAVAAAAIAMGAAIIPQISALGEASDAQKAYEDAVAKSGRTSQEAVAAQLEYQRIVATLPPATREAAAAVGILKDEYKDWSDSLAADTMAPFIKGVQVTNALVPKTTGLVKAASTEADRFMTIIGGEVTSPGLDALNSKFTSFTQRTLRHMNDELVHLLRTSGSGEVGGNAREFMTWARAQGPTVASVLQNVATTLLHLLQAGSDVGVGLLDAVDVIADLVSAVPPDAIAIFLQLALAIKVVKAAALGLMAARAALAVFGTQIVTMNAAAAATPGTMAGASAAIATLSKGAKLALAGTGIGLLIIGLSELSSMGKSAPPDVDRLTTSLGELAQTGKVSGEAAKAWGSDLGGLADSLRVLARPSTLDSTQQFLTSLVGMDSTPVKEAKADLDSVDKALASLVQGGKADLAAAAYERVADAMRKQGMTSGELRAELGDYKSALADAAFEAELVAQSQGLFGAEAQKVQAKLDGQKASADGLRQSLQALNEVNRQGLGGMIGFEAAIDAAAKAAKENAGALSMSHGELNLNSEKARTAASALQDLASKTDGAAASARESGASWETVGGIYDRGRAKLIENAQAMGLTKAQAAQLADQILKIPDKVTLLKGDVSDLDDKIAKAQDKVDSLKQKRKTAVGADKADLDKKVAAAQARLDALRQKRAVALQAIDKASKIARDIAEAIRKIRSKTVTITTVQHTLGIEGTAGRNNAKYNGYAGGGSPSAGEIAMVGEEGPELVMFGRAAKVFDAKTTAGMLNGTASAGQAAAQGLAAGLVSSAGVYVAARAMAGSVIAGIRDELEIRSPSKKTEALMKDVGKGMIKGLTGTRDQIKATAKDLAADIWKAFTGKKDNQLVAMVNKQTKKLLDLAAKRDKIAAKIAEAKAYAGDFTKSARESAGLSNLGMEQVTAGGIKAGLASKLAQIKQFTQYIGILAKKGLNKGLLRQILNMGPEAGYAYASALVGADKETFKQINSMQSQLDTSTTKLGKLGADALYDSGKNAAKGFLTGLASQEKELEKLMEKIALSMQKSLKKALGISSPARKMIPDGINTARGVAVGVMAGLPFIDSAMDAVAGRMAGRAAIAPVAGRAAIVRGASQTMEVHVDINGAMDPVAVGRELQRVLLMLKRTQGLNVTLGVG